MLPTEPERPVSDDLEPSDVDLGTTDLDADARDALQSLQEALDGSQQIAALIAEIEQTIADWKTQRAEVEFNVSDQPGHATETESAESAD